MSEEADLIKRLACLERSVTTMQEQLAHLALELLRERQWSSEQRIAALEACVQHLLAACLASPAMQETNVADPADANSSPGRRLLPAELRARSRVILLTPDSPQRFDWLATLTSFHFVGPQGRFAAYRNSERGQRTRCWRAHRYFHGRTYKHDLGTTDHPTIASLEQVAAQLQADVDALSNALSCSMGSPPSISNQLQL